MNAVVAHAQLEQLHADGGREIFDAAQDDFRQVGEALLAAAIANDRRALADQRHALIGLCRVFGADALERAANLSFQSENDIAQFTSCLVSTLSGVQDYVDMLAQKENQTDG